MSRRAAVTAAIVVSAIFFVIRFGIVLLSREAAPPPSSPVVVSRSPSSPVYRPPSREEAKRDASAKLMVLASEARASGATKAATHAYDAEHALQREDCAAIRAPLARASDELGPESSARGAMESASRAVDAFCSF